MNEFDLRKFLYNNPLMEKKEDSKKGNKEEQKRMEGAIRDDRDHIKDLKSDIEDNEKKLAKLKKDFKKDVNEMYDSKYEEDDMKEEMKDKKLTKESLKNMIREKISSILNEEETINEADYNSFLNDISTKMSELENKEHKPFLETIKKFVENKLKTLNEAEEVDVDVEKDVNVDVEDEVDVDDESVESDIEVKTEVPGEDADTAAVLGLLTKAQDEASGMGDEVLMDQIGNTITYFTRKHVVKASS
tara:strand:+ start:2174 stop:2911 length:738 start_codon:yes stop_codon:yes gene_type:complete